MAIKSFKLIEPPALDQHYTAIVQTDGGYEPMGGTALTNDRRLYTLRYRSVPGAASRQDTWGMGIIYVGGRERAIQYAIVDEAGNDIFAHRDEPPVRDGM